MFKSRPRTTPWSTDFDHVLEEELNRVGAKDEPPRDQVEALTAEERADSACDPVARAHYKQLVGLAFSGGGIRSATFNLGVLQGLAQMKLLSMFDYLSTVSGGGYIGSWFIAWTKRREKFDDVKFGLCPDRVAQPGNSEPEEIHFLRRFSNYLTPKLGWLGADTWTVVAIYLRNLILNFAILATAFIVVLLAPRWLAFFSPFITQLPVPLLATMAVGALLCAAIAIVRSMRYFGTSAETRDGTEEDLPLDSDWKDETGAAAPINTAGKVFHEQPYEDFTLKLEFRIVAPGSGSIHVWAPVTSQTQNGQQTTSIGPGAARVYLSSAEQAGRNATEAQKLFATGQINRRKPPFPAKLLPSLNELTIVCSNDVCTVQLNGLTINRARVQRAPMAESESLPYVIGFSNRGGAVEFSRVRATKIESPQSTGGTQSQVQWRVVVPLFLAAFLATILFGFGPFVPAALRDTLERPKDDLWSWLGWSGGIGLGSAAVLAVAQAWVEWLPPVKRGFLWIGRKLRLTKVEGSPAQPKRPRPTDKKSKAKRVVAATLFMGLAAAVGGLAARAVYFVFKELNGWEVTAWGTPTLVGLFLFTIVLYIGLLGRLLVDERREWWSRLSAWLLIYALAWVAICGVAFYAPVILARTEDWLEGTVSLAWIISTIAGLVAARSAATGAERSNKATEIIAKTAPYIFVVGFFFLLSWAVDALLPHIGKIDPESPELRAIRNWELLSWHWQNMDRVNWWQLLCLTVVALVITGGLSFRLDINQFSMHLFYRNRLGRCYLGASNRSRRAQPFTGFSARDDLELHELADLPFRNAGIPYPIINTALNLVGGKELAWQQRKAASFVFSPHYCGYDFPELPAGFVETKSFAAKPRPVTLATAMAISGAAASPNMGYHTSPAPAFLMTVFNVRLGWWLGNPRREEGFERSGPANVLLSLTAELFGLTNEQGKYIYLSDGGHFENLGIYELVRRRCRFIIACDAEEDHAFNFGGLGNAIEKCRADLGVDIDIDVGPIKRRAKNGHSQWHCAIGKLRYSLVDQNARDGILVYLKSSLTGDEPADVLRYAAQHPEFPHQTTGDQWFDESQFESYRALGQHVVEDLFAAVDVAKKVAAERKEDIFVELAQRWYPPSAATKESFTRHTRALVAIYKELRDNRELSFLSAQVYPEWRELFSLTEDFWSRARSHFVSSAPQSLSDLLPKKTEQLKAGFYLCNSVIQLMEDVYVDLDLEEQFNHPDNRGWMNYFKHWSWAPMFRVTWSICASTYGARFQTFCERHLGMTVGGISIKQVQFEEKLQTPAPEVERLSKMITHTMLKWVVSKPLGPEVLNAAGRLAQDLDIEKPGPSIGRLNEVATPAEIAATEGRILRALSQPKPSEYNAPPSQPIPGKGDQVPDAEWTATAALLDSIIRRDEEAAAKQVNAIAPLVVSRAVSVAAHFASKKMQAFNRTELRLMEYFFVFNPSLMDHAKIYRFELTPGYQIRASSPESSREDLRFSVGLAVVADVGNPRLVFFRVQDHLRRMGLGRRVLEALIREYPSLVLDLRESHPDAHEVLAQDDRLRFERLFDSVRISLGQEGVGEKI